MRTSHLYVILISALVVQISSEPPTDLEKILKSILSSSFEIAAQPITDLLIEVPMKSDIENYLKEFSWKLKRFMEQTQEEVFSMLPPAERENKKKMIGYLSMYMSGAFSKAANSVTTVTNKSFDTLPDNIKTKFLDIGHDIDDFLRKLRVDLKNIKT